jgi:hypothetical protein
MVAVSKRVDTQMGGENKGGIERESGSSCEDYMCCRGKGGRRGDGGR